LPIIFRITMDGIYTFSIICAAIILLFIIVPRYNRQRRRVKHYLLTSGDIQPVFLLKSVEKKLSTLADILYADGLKIPGSVNPDRFRQLLIMHLQLLETDYTNKRITLGEYDSKLLELLNRANRFLFSTNTNIAANN
jgi:hypothetical protein